MQKKLNFSLENKTKNITYKTKQYSCCEQPGTEMTENFVKAASVKNECVEKEKMRLTHI